MYRTEALQGSGAACLRAYTHRQAIKVCVLRDAPLSFSEMAPAELPFYLLLVVDITHSVLSIVKRFVL
ncbi:MAG: hypothetical protein MUC65_02215 [Pontiellaceae bacterium]|jgi:hypothetical protein|nr:hypothetical protein [Pontiellaceae bacterium]